MYSKSQNRNSFYKQDTEKAIKMCRVLSQFLGLWPLKSSPSSIFQNLLKLFQHLIYYSFTLFTYFSSILHIIFVLNDVHSKLIVIGPVIFWTMLMLKYTLFWKRGGNIQRCIFIIEEDWKNIETPEHRDVMIKSAKFGNYMINVCASFMYIGGSLYHLLIPLTANSIVTEKNITVQPFPSPAYGEFFTSGLSPVYEIVFTILTFSGVVNDTLNVMTFSLAAVLILHSCGQFNVIIMHLNRFVTEANESQENNYERLVVIVQRHLRLLRFIAQVENLLSEVYLIEVLGSTVIICLLGYYIIVAFKELEVSVILTYTFLIVSFVFNIFIYCLLGELLTNQSMNVGESIYLSEWYNLPKHTIMDLIFLLRIFKSPTKITVGKFANLSLDIFIFIIKTSSAYFNFLWKVTQ